MASLVSIVCRGGSSPRLTDGSGAMDIQAEWVRLVLSLLGRCGGS
jgi:hypothetical protein